MPKAVHFIVEDACIVLPRCLKSEGFTLIAPCKSGVTGVDLLAPCGPCLHGAASLARLPNALPLRCFGRVDRSAVMV
jgi:hypothetical protein